VIKRTVISEKKDVTKLINNMEVDMANPKPAITFRVNITNRDPALTSDLPPYNTTLVGNETVTESTSQITTRSASFPTIAHGNQQQGYTVGGNFNNLKNNDTFVAYGLNAYYIKNTFASGLATDTLEVVSIDWS
jgi:hypothetical protein